MNSPQVQEAAQCFARLGLQARNIAGDLVLVEDTPHLRQEAWQFTGELGSLFGCLGEIQQFLANQVIKRALRAESSLDVLRRPALIDPNLFEIECSLSANIPPTNISSQIDFSAMATATQIAVPQTKDADDGDAGR